MQYDKNYLLKSQTQIYERTYSLIFYEVRGGSSDCATFNKIDDFGAHQNSLTDNRLAIPDFEFCILVYSSDSIKILQKLNSVT
jgi:hypothetical protein